MALMRNRSGAYASLDQAYGSSEIEAARYEQSNGASLEWAFQKIAPHQYAVVITMGLSSEGGWGPDVDDAGESVSAETSTWYAIEGESLRSVLEVTSGGQSDLVYSGGFEQISVTPTDQLAHGHYTLKHVTETSAWGDDEEASADTPKVTTHQKMLVWDPKERVYKAQK